MAVKRISAEVRFVLVNDYSLTTTKRSKGRKQA